MSTKRNVQTSKTPDITLLTEDDSIKMLINLRLMPPAYAPIPLALLPEVDAINVMDKAATAIRIVTRRDTNKDFNVFGM